MKKLIALIACAAAFGSAAAQTVSGPGNLSVVQTEVVRGANGFPVIVGVVSNTGATIVHDAFVKFNLYDAQGNIVGNTIAHGQNIGPGERWEFEAPFVAATAATYKITEVNTF
ncbi:FxLYD domain-containing protein [Paraburkholderia nemoris]|uniref:FxLYD domain-containing protein n=1 Tax=Paraburkholderia nemoris TaxID=2793076 RepID=UPI0038BD58AA